MPDRLCVRCGFKVEWWPKERFGNPDDIVQALGGAWRVEPTGIYCRPGFDAERFREEQPLAVSVGFHQVVDLTDPVSVEEWLNA